MSSKEKMEFSKSIYLDLKEILVKEFENLRTFIEQNSENNHCLIITLNRKSPDNPLNHISAFNVIISKPLKLLEVTLISYNGNILHKEVFDEVNDVKESKILKDLNNDNIKLCPGFTELPDNVEFHYIIKEKLSNNIIYRSIQCDFAIQSSTEICASCLDLNSNDKYSNIKLEPDVILNQEPDSNNQDEIDDLDYNDDSLANTIDDSDEEDSPKLKGPKKSKKEPKLCYSCTKCPRKFRLIERYEKHIAKCNGEIKESKPPPLVLSDPHERSCTICFHDFKNNALLNRHLGLHKQRLNFDRTFNCPNCDATFDSPLKLNPHFRDVHDSSKGVCIECYEILNLNELRSHINYRHFYGVKDHLCSLCGKSFPSAIKLKIHMSNAHGSSESFRSVVCDHCGKVFPHYDKLHRHIFTKHNTTRVYTCSTCNKTFMKPLSYYRHIKIHSLVKPWVCAVCNYRAVRRDNVRLHIKKVHKFNDASNHIIKDGKIEYEFKEDEKIENSSQVTNSNEIQFNNSQLSHE